MKNFLFFADNDFQIYKTLTFHKYCSNLNVLVYLCFYLALAFFAVLFFSRIFLYFFISITLSAVFLCIIAKESILHIFYPALEDAHTQTLNLTCICSGYTSSCSKNILDGINSSIVISCFTTA